MRFSAHFSKFFLAPAAALAVVSVLSFACRDMRPRSPEWVVWAPEKAIMGVSFHLGWMLERPEIREAIAKYPVLDQTLEIFLDKAKIDPASETARASLYVMDIPDFPSPEREKITSITSLDAVRGMALVQLAGFRDPKAIQRVIVESFPPEGSLKIGGREYPLFVFLDINNMHLRVFLGGDDRLWIGDITALHGVAQRHFAGESSPLAKAAEWIQPSGAVQGFVQPELVPKEALGTFASAIPAGVKALAWSASTTEKDPEALSLNLAATGTEEGVAQVKPWAQRLTAAASAVSGDGMPPPETLQEKTRMGLKCQLKREQMDKVVSMMNLGSVIMLPPDTATTNKPDTKK